MDPRTRVLVVDFSLALGATGVGALGTTGPSAWALATTGFGAGILCPCLYVAEQTAVLTTVDERSPLSYVAAFGVTLAVGLVLVLGWTVVASPAAALLLGMGVGLGFYRVRYGVLTPVPGRRREQAQGREALELDPPTGQS